MEVRNVSQLLLGETPSAIMRKNAARSLLTRTLNSFRSERTRLR
jgi:hypothetical protein